MLDAPSYLTRGMGYPFCSVESDRTVPDNMLCLNLVVMDTDMGAERIAYCGSRLRTYPLVCYGKLRLDYRSWKCVGTGPWHTHIFLRRLASGVCLKDLAIAMYLSHCSRSLLATVEQEKLWLLAYRSRT